jgi:hypothetical protein
VLYRRQRLEFFSNLLHIRAKARHALLDLQHIAQLIKCVIQFRLSNAGFLANGDTETRHATLHLHGSAATGSTSIDCRLGRACVSIGSGSAA